MVTLMILALVLLFLPAEKSQRILAFFWRRSLLRLSVEAGGKKIRSFKDEVLTKKNQKQEGKTE